MITYVMKVTKNGQSISNEELTDRCRRVDLKDLYRRASRYGKKFTICSQCKTTLQELIDLYKNIPTEDLTLRVSDGRINQSASGGGDCRDMKEQVRKAFINYFKSANPDVIVKWRIV